MQRYKILLSLLCVGVFVFLAVGSFGTDEESATIVPPGNTEPVTQPEPEPDPEPTIQYISINETTTFAEWEYKVIDVQYHKTLKDERARGTYVVFMLEVTNNSNVPRDIGSMFQLEDDNGRVVAFDSSASLSHHHTFRDDTWHYEDIGASFTAIMPIAFDIPEDTKTLYFYPKRIRDEEFKDTAVIVVDR